MKASELLTPEKVGLDTKYSVSLTIKIPKLEEGKEETEEDSDPNGVATIVVINNETGPVFKLVTDKAEVANQFLRVFAQIYH